MEQKTILFVDDEPLVLNALRRMIHPLSRTWTMHFVENGPKALEVLEREAVHVIVTDMRMPGMSGYDLLREVRRRWPRAVRVILTGQPDQETHNEALGVTHYFLWKPIELAVLRALLERINRLELILRGEALQTLIGSIDSLPTLPELYFQITSMLGRSETTIEEISALVSRDMAMTAQLLKTVNSAFLGLRRNIVSLREAIIYLGLDAIRSMVLVHHLFSTCEEMNRGCSVRALWDHSVQVGGLAQRIAEQWLAPAQDSADAFLAGLLHDVGKLILACKMPGEYREIQQETKEGSWSASARERTLLGTDHAAIGGYLAGLWGLPQPVVEALTMHHAETPPEQGAGTLPLEAVWHANRLAHGINDASQEFSDLVIRTV